MFVKFIEIFLTTQVGPKDFLEILGTSTLASLEYEVFEPARKSLVLASHEASNDPDRI